MKFGVQSSDPVPSPLSRKAAPVGSDEVVSVGVVPSGSLAVTAKRSCTFSVILCAPIVVSTGVHLALRAGAEPGRQIGALTRRNHDEVRVLAELDLDRLIESPSSRQFTSVAHTQ